MNKTSKNVFKKNIGKVFHFYDDQEWSFQGIRFEGTKIKSQMCQNNIV